MLKILTIDDHEVVRRGIKEMFTEESATFGEARSGAEALALVRKQQWDIAVLDISLGGRSGLEVLSRAKATSSANACFDTQHACGRAICSASFQGRRLGLHQQGQFRRRVTPGDPENHQGRSVRWSIIGGKDGSPAFAARQSTS